MRLKIAVSVVRSRPWAPFASSRAHRFPEKHLRFGTAFWMSRRWIHYQSGLKVKRLLRAAAFRYEGRQDSRRPNPSAAANACFKGAGLNADQASALQVVDVDRESRHSYTDF